MISAPFNPLDKNNLARSIEFELVGREPSALAETELIRGAGVYAIYYAGELEFYKRIRADVGTKRFDRPIYVGKAIPKGGRKGGLSTDASRGTALRDRLRQHASSIAEATNLNEHDFWIRHLTVDDIWIPLGENVLIERFKPLWNRALDGFGNKDPGRRRATQYRSPWDVMHPGRAFTHKLADGGLTFEFLTKRVDDYLSGRPLAKLPGKIEADLKRAADEVANAVDEA